MSRPMKQVLVTDETKTRVGVMDDDATGVFVWVGRHDDDADAERVAWLTREQTLKLISSLTKALLKGGSR